MSAIDRQAWEAVATTFAANTQTMVTPAELATTAVVAIHRAGLAIVGSSRTCDCSFDPSFTGGYCDTCGKPEHDPLEVEA